MNKFTMWAIIAAMFLSFRGYINYLDHTFPISPPNNYAAFVKDCVGFSDSHWRIEDCRKAARVEFPGVQ